MPPRFSTLLDLKSVSIEQVEFFFSLASSLKQRSRRPSHRAQTIALAFFEPSTRTRLSFETAVVRAGFSPLLFEGGRSTSLEKGETIEDSILNIAALQPSALVIRCGDKVNLAEMADRVSMPVINAGWGIQGHPTQALLDLFTLREKWKGLHDRKLLIVGDLKHSRVAASHLEIFERLGLQIAQCGPENFTVSHSKVKQFATLRDGLEWADAVMALRFQFERHDQSVKFSHQDYHSLYGLNSESIKALRKEAWILHPGPVHHGVEMSSEILSDPRTIILEQVTNGAFIREALIRTFSGDEP